MANANSSEMPQLGRSSPDNAVRAALEATDRVNARLDDALGGYLDIVYLLLGMIPNASRRIITELKSQTGEDHCAVFHASRIFNNALGAFILLRKGMLIEATTLARSALETVAQAVLLMRDPVLAGEWLGGKQLTPAEVRKKLKDKLAIAPLYTELSNITHPNPQARGMHSVDIPSVGYAIFYGGTYQPKRAATLMATLINIILTYLDEFYVHYSGRLSVDNWPFMIELGQSLNDSLRRWIVTFPEDAEVLSAHLADQSPPSPMPPLAVDKSLLQKVISKLKDSRQSKRSSGGRT